MMATVIASLYPAAKRAGSPVEPHDSVSQTHRPAHPTPEASRTVAGGPGEASDRRLTIVVVPDPGRGHGDNSRRLVFDPRPRRGRETGTFAVPVVARFARTTGYRPRRLRRRCGCDLR